MRVSPRLCMPFAMRRLRELARRRRIPLNVCFVDLEKANGSVDGELLWKVLARAEILAEMIAVIRQFHFHDGIRARVRMDDGELSDWFLVTQGLRQGCMPPPPLFNVFFGAPPKVIAWCGGRHRKKGGVVRNLDKCRKENFNAFGATYGPIDDESRVFGVPKASWTEAAKAQGGVEWYAGVVTGAARFMASCHIEEEEGKTQDRATTRATKTKSGKEKARTKGAGRGQQKRSETALEESKRKKADRVARLVED